MMFVVICFFWFMLILWAGMYSLFCAVSLYIKMKSKFNIYRYGSDKPNRGLTVFESKFCPDYVD